MAKALKQTRAMIALGIVLACCTCALALDPSLDVNQYAHTAWKVREGFFKSEITAIAQTSDGYLWLGTDFGLLRFDGARNLPWQPPANQHLPPGRIYSLLATRDGTLWIGAKGLASWKGGTLTQYPELADQYISALLEDRGGTVWVGSSGIPAGKLCAIHSGSVHCYGDDGRLGIGVVGLYEDGKGNLWAGVVDGLWRWGPGPPKFYPLAGEPDGIQAICEDPDGTLLVGWKGGLYRFIDGKTELYPLPGVQHFHAKRLLRDRDGGLWIETWNGGLMHLHQRRTDLFTQSDGLSGDDPWNMFEDREGSIWVGTLGGLDRFRDVAAATFTVKQGLSSDLAGPVLADKEGSIWLGTHAGLNRWNHHEMTIPRTASGKRDGKLNGQAPTSLFQDDRGRIWVPTLREFGYLENGRFTSISGVPGGNILSIVQDSGGNLWVDNERLGLFHISPQSEVRQIPWTGLGRKDHASALAADRSQGGLWIGFFLGGIAYFSDGHIRTSYTANDGLGAGRVSDFLFGENGTLWISTEGGLSRLKDNRLATLTSKNGLPCDTVHWAMEDDDHSMWLYTACGLVRIARSELDTWTSAIDQRKDPNLPIHVTVFDSSDGVRSLSSPGHYHPLVAKTSDGKLWFLPKDGVSVIDPRNLHDNKIPPPVHIEKITADDKTYDITNGMSLPARVRNLEIDYTALSLAVPEKVRFRYKLEGQNRNWHEVINERKVQYTNLAPGNYRFRVLACNNSGVWNEEGASLDFVIPPAWYQTNWFRAACVAAFLAILWGIYELRVRQLAHQFNMRLEERVSERTRIARDLHDTLLQSFQGLVFRFQAARYQLPDRPEEASEALDSALVSADQAIAEGRSAIQELRSGSSAESNLEQMLLAMGRELASSQDGGDSAPALRLIVEGSRRAKRAIIKEEVYRIARELLRNAYRHAHARSIEAELRYDDDAFLLVVRDDGKGMDPKLLKDHGRTGHWGLPGMYERAEGMGARLDIWSEAGAGTEVRLTVPAAIAYEKSGDRGRFKLFRKTRIYEHRS
jgi:ligand-binding sensor domain-containing protein/signal transduction histidine kinase